MGHDIKTALLLFRNILEVSLEGVQQDCGEINHLITNYHKTTK